MTYRLIATDLDGTLSRSDGTASPRTVEALRRAEGCRAARGHRHWPAAALGTASLRETLGHTGLAVFSNGPSVYDLHTDKVLNTRPFPRAVLLKIAETVHSALPDRTFAVESIERGFGREPGYVTHSLDES